MLRFKSGYRNGHISAGESAANRMEVLITELHEQGWAWRPTTKTRMARMTST
jgi:hypothetical protein